MAPPILLASVELCPNSESNETVSKASAKPSDDRQSGCISGLQFRHTGLATNQSPASIPLAGLSCANPLTRSVRGCGFFRCGHGAARIGGHSLRRNCVRGGRIGRNHRISRRIRIGGCGRRRAWVVSRPGHAAIARHEPANQTQNNHHCQNGTDDRASAALAALQP